MTILESGLILLKKNIVGTKNIAIGSHAMNPSPACKNNVVIGHNALGTHYGDDNIAIGNSTGTSLTANDSKNIVIGHLDQAGEYNTVRIGTNQTRCFIAGATFCINHQT